MDISALLSPDPESTETTPKSPAISANKSSNNHQNPVRPPNQPRKSSGLSQQVDFFSHHNSVKSPSIPHQLEQRQSLPSIAAYNAAAANAARPTTQSRKSSSDDVVKSHGPLSAGMDALAEVASRQRPQTIVRLNEHRSSSSSVSHGAAASIRSPAEPLVPEPSRSLAPPAIHSFQSASLSEDESRELAVLARALNSEQKQENEYIQFVTLLHSGFSRHLESGKEANLYELLRDLRHAREFMDETVPVGEDIWVDWLSDENMLARTLDDRLSLMELHSRSVQEEPKSTQLWRLYGDYMYFLWTCSHRADDGDTMDWQPEDKAVGSQVFTWEKMMEVWEAGIENTQSHINDSNHVWDRYIEVVIKDLAKQPTARKVEQIKQAFVQRLLQQPHLTWDQTFQNFSSFISTYDNKNYEEIMVDISRRSSQIKASYAMREPYETRIQQAIEQADRESERAIYAEYLSWELKHQGVFSLNLITALYERATTRFRTDANFWKDFIEFLISASNAGHKLPAIPTLERATRRCRTSGELWSHRLLAMEAENFDFQAIESVKHQATASLQENREGLDDLLTVYIAWCGFLRRRAIMANSHEDELDIAEVGVRSALENYRKTGEKLLGKDFNGDPQYRLERINIRLLAQRDDVEGARAIWRDLIKTKADSYDFWYRWYIWAMVIWGKSAFIPTAEGSLPENSPREATIVLRQALKQIETMDAPEQLVEMFLNHCEQHETVEQYRLGMIEARSARKKIAERRERERQEQWTTYYAQQEAQAQAEAQAQKDAGMAIDSGAVPSDSKRKHDGDQSNDISTAKKARLEERDEEMPDAAERAPKRNREQAVIVMKNLPDTATETKVRQFFRDCGTINSIKLSTDEQSRVATVEFETADEARYAQSRVIKPFDGQEIEIEFLSGATLWVTNYPPTADEKYIRNLFQEFGEISEVRFPSLQVNTHRRFCYVQFMDAESAKNATALDGRVLDGQFHLAAKISDPNRKDNRQGALYDGREVYVRNVSWKASTDDVRKLFEQFGAVEKVRIPVNDFGKSKGVAFVAFEQAGSVADAIEGLNNTPFMARTITVEQSVAKAKRTLTSVIHAKPPSASPEPTTINGHAMSIGSPKSNHEGDRDKSYEHTARKRTMALLDVPDTVNSARLEALLTPFGSINKLTLRPDHGGATVEFAEEKSVGAAGLALTGSELDGKTIRTGTVAELMAQKPELKAQKLSDVKKVKEKNSKTAMMSQGPISRPGAARRGGLGSRKTGLGFGSGASRSAAAAAATATATTVAGEESGGAKSNADFRDMFIRAKENGAATSEAKDGADESKE